MAWGYGNLGSGGGSSSVFGIIIVNYPEGSVLTITGGRTVDKELSSTQKAYYVKEAGVYSITSSDPVTGESTFKQVEIINLAQVVTITLTYRLYIVQSGVVQNGFNLVGVGKSYNSSGNTATSCNISYRDGYVYLTGQPQSTRSGTYCRTNDIKSIVYSNGQFNYTYLYMDVSWYSVKSNGVMEVSVGIYSGSKNNTYAVDNFITGYRTAHNNSNSRETHKYNLNSSAITSDSAIYPTVAFNVSTIGDSTCCYANINNIYLSNASE